MNSYKLKPSAHVNQRACICMDTHMNTSYDTNICKLTGFLLTFISYLSLTHDKMKQKIWVMYIVEVIYVVKAWHLYVKYMVHETHDKIKIFTRVTLASNAIKH